MKKLPKPPTTKEIKKQEKEESIAVMLSDGFKLTKVPCEDCGVMAVYQKWFPRRDGAYSVCLECGHEEDDTL